MPQNVSVQSISGLACASTPDSRISIQSSYITLPYRYSVNMVDTPKKDTEKSTTAKVDDGEKKEEPKEEERVMTIEEG